MVLTISGSCCTQLCVLFSVQLRWTYRCAAEEIFLRLTLEPRGMAGGFGPARHSGGAGRGFMTVFNAGRVSAEDVCNVGNLRSASGTQIKTSYLKKTK